MGPSTQGDREEVVQDVDVHRRFADSAIQHRGDWSQCDAEGLRRLAAHLYALRDLPEYRHALYDLIDESWMRARRERGDWTGAGFLADVELAWEAAITDNGIDTILLIRLKTAREGVRDQASCWSDELLQALVWLDQADPAIELARLRTSASSQFKGLLAVHDALVARGLPQPAVLAEARELARVLSEQRQDPFDENARALQRLAGAFAALDDIDSAHKVAASIHPKGVRIATLCRLAVTTAATRDARADAFFHQARTLAGEIGDTGFQEIALADVAAALAEAGRLDEARTTAATIQSAWNRAETLVRMAASLPITGAAHAEPLFAEARTLAAALRLEPEPEFRLGQIAAAFARAGRPDDARAVADWIPASHRDEALRKLTGALARAGRFDEANEAAGRIGGAWRARMARQELVGTLAQAERFDATEVLLAAMDDPNEALCELTVAFATVGRHQQAHDTSRRIEPGPARVKALAGLAIAMARTDPGGAGALLEEACAAQDPQRALPPDETLIRLVAALGHFSQPNAARTLANRIPGRFERMEGMGALAAALVRRQDPEAGPVLAEARLAAGSEDDEGRADALGRLALGLAREGAFAEARAIAEGCDPGVRIRIADAEHCQALREGRAEADPDSIRDAACMWEAREDRATASLLEGGAWRFFAGLQPRSGSDSGILNGTLEELFRWAELLRQVDPDRAPAVLREAIRVAGWFRPDWRTIYPLLPKGFV